MTKNYQVPRSFNSSEYEIKKSRFICWIAPASSREDAIHLLEKAKHEYPDARHHCWAYIIGDPKNAVSAAAHDDGEPSGTAGKPILNVIHHKNIGDVVVIVIRYFGGVKLGTGGLVRAYGRVTQLATEKLKLTEKIPYQKVTIQCHYSDEPNLRYWLEKYKGDLISSEYGQLVSLKISIPTMHLSALAELVSTWDDGKITKQNS